MEGPGVESDDSSIFVVQETEDAAYDARLVRALAPAELPLNMRNMWLSISEAPPPSFERCLYPAAPGAPPSKYCIAWHRNSRSS